MPLIVQRPKMTWLERIYLPAIAGGFAVTVRHFLERVFRPRRGKLTMEYPEQKWIFPEGYRGAPVLVRDQDGREKCVACQLCEFVCPPKAIRVTPAEMPPGSPHGKVEKAPREFEIDMLRCIYCGYCEEACPERAIVMGREYALTGRGRAEMVHNKKRLLEMGGTVEDRIQKWRGK